MFRIKKKITQLAFASMFLIFSSASQAVQFDFEVFENDPGGFSGTVDITLVGAVLTTKFTNTSSNTTAVGPVMGQLYFESGAADWIDNPMWTNTADVDFGMPASPANPPGGTNIGWAGTAFSFGGEPPPSMNGLNPTEMLTIDWDWLGGDFNAFLADIISGDSRIATHVLDCTDNGNSCTAKVVPIPAAVWLFGTGLVGLIGFSRRKSTIAA